MKGFSESLKAPAIGIRETPHAINLPVRETTPCNSLDASFPQSSLWVFRMLDCWFSAPWPGAFHGGANATPWHSRHTAH